MSPITKGMEGPFTTCFFGGLLLVAVVVVSDACVQRCACPSQSRCNRPRTNLHVAGHLGWDSQRPRFHPCHSWPDPKITKKNADALWKTSKNPRLSSFFHELKHLLEVHGQLTGHKLQLQPCKFRSPSDQSKVNHFQPFSVPAIGFTSFHEASSSIPTMKLPTIFIVFSWRMRKGTARCFFCVKATWHRSTLSFLLHCHASDTASDVESKARHDLPRAFPHLPALHAS